MKVDITDLLSCENKETEEKVEIGLGSFTSKLGEFPMIEKAPFILHLTNQENKRLLIQGETDVTIAVPCDRCLTEVPTRIHLAIDRKYYIEETGKEEDQESIQEDYVDAGMLDVDKLIYDEILVNWPMKVLCTEDCKGICKKCGINLNTGTCTCDQAEPDPRMAAIQDIFKQFKEV